MAMVMLGGQRVEIDEESGAIGVQVEMPSFDWTLLRTVTASDVVNPVTPFIAWGSVDILVENTGGVNWGSCTVALVVLKGSAGHLAKMPFRDATDSVALTANAVIPGVCAFGPISVKITAMTTVTELKVYVRNTP